MPVYLFWGDEDFTLEKEIETIKNKALFGDSPDGGNFEISPLNYRRLENPDFKTLIDALRCQPMMFGNIVYKIRADKYFLETTKKIKLDEKQTDEIIKALEMVSDRVFIIFTCPIDKGDRKKPDSRKKIFKSIQKIAPLSGGEIKEFTAFKAYEEYKILPVVKNMAKNLGLKADNDTLTILIRQIGPSLRDLDAALNKIKLTIHPNDTISKEIALESGKGGQNIFALSDLILEKQYSKALLEISNLLNKSHYLEILAFLQSTFSKILQTKVYSKSMSSFDIAKKTGQNEFIVKKSLEKLSRVDVKEIIRIKQNLTAAEYDIKTGAKDPALAFECALLTPYALYNKGGSYDK